MPSPSPQVSMFSKYRVQLAFASSSSTSGLVHPISSSAARYVKVVLQAFSGHPYVALWRNCGDRGLSHPHVEGHRYRTNVLFKIQHSSWSMSEQLQESGKPRRSPVFRLKVVGSVKSLHAEESGKARSV